MSRKARIMVFRLKEIIYTAIFVALGVLLIVLLVHMFSSKSEDTPASGSIYIPGIYTTSMTIGGQSMDVEVTVDADHINSIRLVNLNESITTMYPLMEPTIENLEEQILAAQSLDYVVHEESQKYTSTALLQTIEKTLEKAKRE